jgi:tungstate transport system substrate-binding protein
MSTSMPRGMVRIRIIWLLASLLVVGGSLVLHNLRNPEEPVDSGQTLVLATTTSVQDSGLLDVLLPAFQRQTGIYVRVKAVGSGRALELARIGEADVVLCHSPALEEQFVRDGFSDRRLPVAVNEYAIVGPAADPAGVRRARSAPEALRQIAAARAPFISRADGSGTHHKEQELWKAAGIEPAGAWYLRAMAGMGAVLRQAGERRAYTLTDRATYTAYRARVPLALLHAGSPGLENPYSLLVVSPRQPSAASVAAARRFAEFLTGPDGQALIQTYGVEKYGEPLFRPSGAARP